MIRRTILVLFSSVMLFAVVKAQDRGVGLGVVLGEPTGVSFKSWLTRSTAIDAAVAWAFGNNGHLHVHADYLYHNYSIFPVKEGKLPLYLGLGGRVRFGDGTRFGLRGVIGIDYMFSGAPLDLFLEVAPIFDVAPSTTFSVHGGLGARFFF